MSGHEFVSAFGDADGIDAVDQSTNITEETMAEMRAIAARYPDARSALMPMLHLVQSVDGRVSDAGMRAVAEIAGVNTAQVNGVATFYTMYKRRPAGHQHIGVCTTALCAVMGGDILLSHVEKKLGIHEGDHPRREVQPRAPRVQCGLRLRARDDGQLGIHGQYDPRQGRRAARQARRRRDGQVHPRRHHHRLAQRRARARRIRRRTGR